ncbi:hypothetical protein MAR_002570 [Mya arenaria]|uniref:Uncharacterized protein n=1 Tax=Mya arenaria TaxID=6604 RepID=A0ABY7G3F8_MYAAR|nr:hypothetical protein MAR_002570 [Mya arenaria]
MSGAGIKFDEKLQKERENFIQLLFTVQGPCTFCLEKTLFKYVIDLGTTLDIFLHSKRQEILLWRIGQQRKNEFFPQNGSGTDLETWDVQMYWLILTNILQNVTPTQKHDIENVKDIRNKLCHLPNPKLNEGDFNLYHRQITTFIDETVKLISDEAFETKVKCGLKEIETPLQQTVFNLVKTVHRFYQGQTTLLEEVHATVNHVSANQFPEMKNMVLEIKELIFSHFSRNELKQMKAPEESSVTMKIKNVSVNEEEDLSIGLVNLVMEEINSPMQNELSKALQRALTKFKQYGTLTKVHRGSVVFYIQFDSFLSFIDCYDDVLAGKLTTELKPLEKELQSLLQRQSLELELIINTNDVQLFLIHSSEIEGMCHDLSTEQMRTRPVILESREPDYRDSKQRKHMPKVFTASTLVLPRERQSNVGNDTDAQSAFPAMVLTEEEQLMFREDELCPYVTTLIDETNRKGEEIETRNMEMIQLLERVRGQIEVLLIARGVVAQRRPDFLNYRQASAVCPSEDEQQMSQVERPSIHNSAVIPEAKGTNEKDVLYLKHKNSTLEEKMSDLNHENLGFYHSAV